MNRSIIYSGEQGRTFDQLWQWRDQLAAIGGLELDLAGQTTTVVGGLAATPTAPASLQINLAAGRIYQQAAMDATSYGSLPSDADIVQQQGYAPAQSVLLTTAALSAGQSQWVLIEAQFSQVDQVRAGDPTGGVLYYYNSANPTQPFQGPGGNGQAQNTERLATISIKALYGSPSTTGSEVPPQPEVGWVPLYLIDLTFGQSAILSGNILVAGPSVGANVPSNYPGAPFIAGLLNKHHTGVPGAAPRIDLTAEVKNLLPLANMPASDTTGGLPAMKLYGGNPNGNVAGNSNVNGASDLAYDTIGRILYICTSTGTTLTAVWTAVSGQTSSTFSGGTTSGSANAQVVSATIPAGFSLTPGYVVSAVIGVGLTNTGATTLNVDATGAIAINKNTGSGNVPLAGGELIAGQFASFLYTGVVWLLQAAGLGVLAQLNIGQWLKNDGLGNLTIKNGAGLGDDGSGNFTILNSGVTAATYKRTTLTVNAQGRITAASNGQAPTSTVLTSGTGTYTPPGGCTRIYVSMIAGGGSGAAAGVNGNSGAQSIFGSTTVNPGSGGSASSTRGSGGSGGTGPARFRVNGGPGQYGAGVGQGVVFQATGGAGFFGNGGPGAGGASALTSQVNNPGGGGAGEYAELQVTSPTAVGYSVGAGGASVGGSDVGQSGIIIIDEFYD